jgi:hypothetical protein
MAFFIALHTWKEEDFKVVGRKVIEMIPNMPKGTTMINSFADARQIGAWCIYETENPDEVKAYLDDSIPEMTTELIPVIQFCPPSADLYKLIHVLSR